MLSDQEPIKDHWMEEIAGFLSFSNNTFHEICPLTIKFKVMHNTVYTLFYPERHSEVLNPSQLFPVVHACVVQRSCPGLAAPRRFPSWLPHLVWWLLDG